MKKVLTGSYVLDIIFFVADEAALKLKKLVKNLKKCLTE